MPAACRQTSTRGRPENPHPRSAHSSKRRDRDSTSVAACLRPRPAHRASQPSSKMDEPFPLFVPDGEVRPEADLVLEETIGSHLRATTFAGPAFRGADEPATDSAPTDVGVDVPALDVADRARVARVCMGANGRLHKPREASLRTCGHEGHGSFLPQVFVYLFAVPLWRLIRPKGGAHAQPLRSIALAGATDGERPLFRFRHRPPDGRGDERFFSGGKRVLKSLSLWRPVWVLLQEFP